MAGDFLIKHQSSALQYMCSLLQKKKKDSCSYRKEGVEEVRRVHHEGRKGEKG